MSDKPYPTEDNTPSTVGELAVAYCSMDLGASSSSEWNPNAPFCGTQEEWWNHFRRIEEGKFYTPEEADKEFEVWKKKLLASRM
jgi:hypothetical protein